MVTKVSGHTTHTPHTHQHTVPYYINKDTYIIIYSVSIGIFIIQYIVIASTQYIVCIIYLFIYYIYIIMLYICVCVDGMECVCLSECVVGCVWCVAMRGVCVYVCGARVCVDGCVVCVCVVLCV